MSLMLLDYQVHKPSESIEGVCEQDLAFYNALPYTRDDVYQVSVSTKARHFRIVDEAGCEVVYDCLGTQRVYSGSTRRDPSVYDEDLYYYQSNIRIAMMIKLMSMCILYLETCEHMEQLQECNAPENTFYKIIMESGSLRLLNKANEKVVEDFLYVEDSGDEGDTRDYSWPAHGHIYTLHSQDAQVERKHGALTDALVLYGAQQLPGNLQKRVDRKCSQDIAYTLCIQLHQASDVLQCEITIDNTAMEHRMRVTSRGLSSPFRSIADTPFGTTQRAYDPKYMEDWKEAGYYEESTPTYPMLYHVSNGTNQVLTCFCKGIKEYEILKHTDITLTLLRSVPLFGRPDLNRYLGIASGNEFKYIPTPKPELRQTMNFSFTLCLWNGYDAMEVQKTWLRYADDVLFYQPQEVNCFVNIQKYFVTHPYPNVVKPLYSAIFNMGKSDCLQFSSLYPLDDKQATPRVHNSRDEMVKEDSLCYTGETIQQTNMLYEPIADCGAEQRPVTLLNA